MPRQSHGRSVQPGTSRQRQRKRPKHDNALNALEVAEKQTTDTIKIRQHRLGEIEDEVNRHAPNHSSDGRSSKKRKFADVHEGAHSDAALTESDAGASGSDDEGGRWHEGIDGSEEDSEIDSDEAFGESDEERFAHFTFKGSRHSADQDLERKSSKPRTRTKQVDLAEVDGNWMDAEAFNQNDEEEQEYDDTSLVEHDADDLGDEAVDLATALEMNLEEERKESERSSRRAAKQNKSRPRSSMVEEEEDEGEDEDEDSDSEDMGSDTESALSISDAESAGDHAGLQSFVQSLETHNQGLPHKSKKSRALPAVASSFAIGSSKVSTSDLLQYIRDPAQRESLKLVQASERSGPQEIRNGIPGKLSVPLAKRQQDRLDRAAAYEKSKETLNRWVDTVKSNRRAEHLAFPLVDPGPMGAKNTRTLQNTNSLRPQTDLENTIQTILQESGVGATNAEQFEEQEAAYEDLQEKKLSIEDVRERRAQLRLARDLMFREEIRAKRIKKIKSKAYRRVHRKEKDKIEAQQRDQLAAAGLLESDDEREQNDRRRAEERMGARHKESRWAKGIKQAGRGAWDEDARLGISDLARRDEELRRRIEGKSVNEDDSMDDDNSSSDGDNSEVEEHKVLTTLDRLEDVDAPTSKLGSMLFMQRAEAARKEQNDEEIRRIRHAMGENGEDLSEDEKVHSEPVGRQSFGLRSESKKQEPPPARNEFEARLSEDELSDTSVSHPSNGMQGPHKPLQTSQTKEKLLTAKGSQHRENDHVQSHVNKKLSKPNTITDRRSPLEGKIEQDSYTSPSESEDEIPTPNNSYDAKAALAASIFAGPGDSIQDFNREKKQVIAEEEDQVVDGALPGWGSWTGAGVSKHERRKNKGKFLTTIKGVAANDRKDAKLDRVIINEKRVKKNGKYLATELPHPFETKQQYERSLRLPMGPEWSTVKHYQDAIKPRILLKQGMVIKPMAKPSL